MTLTAYMKWRKKLGKSSLRSFSEEQKRPFSDWTHLPSHLTYSYAFVVISSTMKNIFPWYVYQSNSTGYRVAPANKCSQSVWKPRLFLTVLIREVTLTYHSSLPNAEGESWCHCSRHHLHQAHLQKHLLYGPSINYSQEEGRLFRLLQSFRSRQCLLLRARGEVKLDHCSWNVQAYMSTDEQEMNYFLDGILESICTDFDPGLDAPSWQSCCLHFHFFASANQCPVQR